MRSYSTYYHMPPCIFKIQGKQYYYKIYYDTPDFIDIYEPDNHNQFDGAFEWKQIQHIKTFKNYKDDLSEKDYLKLQQYVYQNI